MGGYGNSVKSLFALGMSFNMAVGVGVVSAGLAFLTQGSAMGSIGEAALGSAIIGAGTGLGAFSSAVVGIGLGALGAFGLDKASGKSAYGLLTALGAIGGLAVGTFSGYNYMSETITENFAQTHDQSAFASSFHNEMAQDYAVTAHNDLAKDIAQLSQAKPHLQSLSAV